MEILYYIKIKYYIPIYNRQQIYVNSGKLLKQDKLCGYFVCNVSCPSRFLCSNLFIVVMTVYINLMQPHLKHRSDFTTCMSPPAPSTSIVIPQCTCTQGKHWIIIRMRSVRKCLFEIVLSPVFFLSHTWVQEKSESFNSLVFLFNQKGKWSIGTRCNTCLKSNFFYHVWNDSHFTAYLCCKRISYVLHVQFCKSHKKWTIGFCLKQEQKKNLKKRNVLPVCSINSIAFILFTKSQSCFHFHVFSWFQILEAPYFACTEIVSCFSFFFSSCHFGFSPYKQFIITSVVC